ncbi:sugar ABC transporter ATP-binding protein [Mesorhizobium sp. M1B.F.Ca.ET.045.04.1.1]|uniref:sugar ABC transporter ATP-binding protein n=1 Tax=Mesorhizobium sp. M1B.F.Ca.ET.045.04.1.1 TaxID=2493673 RepID=UPI000F75FA5E|nr:sugar ABC transporter ATP-binding protein [Mesorhizobium sp. M1B.F.Ca.ET.045.04.1.1]AZO32265.1 sugar ABC transporter ATP-binding protein [Mesorhizobium sp. M1B.F.Ca.ET.045.04.1.1]TKB11503.1 MAG: sugar ABC transporter ATP-binding protein [Mesorhizobium sp.]
MTDIITLRNVSRSFGRIVAVNDVSVTFSRGQRVGLVGHNGAGKSTLLHLITGNLTPTGGAVEHGGQAVASTTRGRADVRCVQQELSLCANLTVAENMRITFPALRGLGWRRSARAAIMRSLNATFPDHGIDPNALVANLPLSKRQQVEIARAFAVLDGEPRLVILDEPTSSLDRTASEQLFKYIEQFVASGGSVILVTHKMDEVFRATDRIVVLRDGAKVADGPTTDFSFESLVGKMGHAVASKPAPSRRSGAPETASPRITTRDAAGKQLIARAGEIVGLAGLAGHGQTEIIRNILAEHRVNGAARTSMPEVALVAGDRRSDGLFAAWSIKRNISICSLHRLGSSIGLNLGAEHDLARHWCEVLQVKCEGVDAPVMSLSGGGQQKALFARALASGAELILMDDPMRGVDIGTKRSVYELVRQEADKGRAFIWYTTEFDELLECDRVYVVRDHLISGELGRDQVSEENIVALSFGQ